MQKKYETLKTLKKKINEEIYGSFSHINKYTSSNKKGKKM